MTHSKGETRRAVTMLLPLAILLLLAIPRPPAHAATQTFNFTGAQQNFVVPAGVTSVTIEAFGAQGGAGLAEGAGSPGAGANGGKVTATIAVTPGESLAVYVGGQGMAPTVSGGNVTGGVGGFNGGAAGGSSFTGGGGGPISGGGGGGGGASDVRQSGSALANRAVVAGGGGGGGGATSTGSTGGAGGAGGSTTGANGGNGAESFGGGGGTQAAGGAGGTGSGGPDGASGALGSGGAGGNGASGPDAGGGGGAGGYYGGGGGEAEDNGGGGGGGGSSFTAAGATSVTHQQGVRTGDGQVILTYTIAAIPTLSEWAQLIMIALLVVGGLLALRRRRSAH